MVRASEEPECVQLMKAIKACRRGLPEYENGRALHYREAAKFFPSLSKSRIQRWCVDGPANERLHSIIDAMVFDGKSPEDQAMECEAIMRTVRRMGRPTFFTPEEESEVVTNATELVAQQDLSWESGVQAAALDIAVRRYPEHKLTRSWTEKGVGRSWIASFLSRHANVVRRGPQPAPKRSRQATDELPSTQHERQKKSAPDVSNSLAVSSALAGEKRPSYITPTSYFPHSKRCKASCDPVIQQDTGRLQEPILTSPAMVSMSDTIEAPSDILFVPSNADCEEMFQGCEPSTAPGRTRIVAPGPVPSDAFGRSSNVSCAWPVLPCIEDVENAIVNADTNPQMFHHTVSRPLSDFVAAVMHFLGVQGACDTKLGTFLVRVLSVDHCVGRIGVYEMLEYYASASNWHGFLVFTLEYIESAGYDTTAFSSARSRRSGGHEQAWMQSCRRTHSEEDLQLSTSNSE